MMIDLDRPCTEAVSAIGGYLMTVYGDSRGSTLQAANAVCALGALAGVFAQVQARVMIGRGLLPDNEGAILEAKTKDGGTYYFGDAINRCLIEGTSRYPSFWVLASAAARDPKIGVTINLAEIIETSASRLGSAEYGVPRIKASYGLTEMPLEAARQHALQLMAKFREISLEGSNLMLVFGHAAQGMAALAAGEVQQTKVKAPMPRVEVVRLYMEAAVPTSKLDLKMLGLI